MRILPVGLMLGLLVAASACGGNDTATTMPPSTLLTTTVPETTPTSGTQPDATVAPTTTAGSPTSTPPATAQPSTVPSTVPSTTQPPTTQPRTASVNVKVYLLRGERLSIAHRDVAGPAVLRAALTELLAGPTAAERTDGVHSEIPDGTTLLDVNLAAGLATVDLTADFERGGGTLSMTARVAEVVFTATQFGNVDRVQFWLDGERIDVLGGEGLVMTEPWTRAMVDRAFTGGVLIDAPAHGGVVGSPFVVTGEGDVFEAQFPIEVWRDGAMIGGIAPVTAGAWGEWADFETTISLDAAPGPIELIAYDAGGCGDAPECPDIIRTVVPLTFTG